MKRIDFSREMRREGGGKMFFLTDWVERIDFSAIRKYRTQNLQQRLKEYGLDALMCFRAENIRYMTGLRPVWWPITFITRNASILAQTGEPVLYVTSGDTARCRQTMNWIPEENIRACATMEDPGIVKTMVQKEFLPTLKKMGVAEGRIGIDAATTAIFEELKRAMPKAEFVDGDRCVQDAGRVKHPEEIKCIRLSVQIADVAMEKAMGRIDSGVRECEVLGTAMETLYSFGMEVAQCSLIVTSGENTAPFHRFASDKPILRGDLVLMDLGGCFNGYFSDFTRTVCLGQPNEQQKRIYTAVYETMMNIIETMKPGVTNVEVNRSARGVIQKHGFEKYAWYGILGHSIGVSALTAPLIGELSATGEREFELQPGMVFSMEPTIIVPGIPGGGGIRIENNLLITEKGNEVLNRTPYCQKMLGRGNCDGPCCAR
jgi:Xaa-Pro aminopeptidase